MIEKFLKIELKKLLKTPYGIKGIKMATKIINLYAGPGAGKSTTAAGLFNLLKLKGYETELVTEFAKDATYECRLKTLENPYYVFGKQYHKIWRIVEYWEERGVNNGVIVTDSPFILTLFYMKDDGSIFGKFKDFILELYNKYDNYNFFIDRVKKYNPNGRNQTEDEARAIDNNIKNFLRENNLKFWNVIGNQKAPEAIKKVLEEEIIKNS